MSDTIFENGKEYVRVKAAASLVGISADYITKLCRSGVVGGLRTKGGWFVDQTSLTTFVAAQDKEKEERRKQQASELRQMQPRAEVVGSPQMTGGGFGASGSALRPTYFVRTAP